MLRGKQTSVATSGSAASAGRFDPVIGRPVMTTGYGLAESRAGLLSWRWVHSRFRVAHNYWIATTKSDGAPHCVPIWGVWLDDVFYFGTDRASRKSRNLHRQPHVVVHLESGEDVVVMEGRAAEVASASLFKRIDRAYLKKYKLSMTDAPGELVVFGVTPRVFLAWRERDFPRSATRMVRKK